MGSPCIRPRSLFSKILMGFCSDGPSECTGHGRRNLLGRTGRPLFGPCGPALSTARPLFLHLSVTILVPICLHCLNCTKFGHLILRKIIKIVVTRCHILRLKCTKFHFGWGSAPDPIGGAHSTPPDPLPTSQTDRRTHDMRSQYRALH